MSSLYTSVKTTFLHNVVNERLPDYNCVHRLSTVIETLAEGYKLQKVTYLHAIVRRIRPIVRAGGVSALASPIVRNAYTELRIDVTAVGTIRPTALCDNSQHLRLTRQCIDIN